MRVHEGFAPIPLPSPTRCWEQWEHHGRWDQALPRRGFGRKRPQKWWWADSVESERSMASPCEVAAGTMGGGGFQKGLREARGFARKATAQARGAGTGTGRLVLSIPGGAV